MNLLNTEAVLFDFDGTVIDSYPGIQQAFDEAFFLTYSVANKVSLRSYIGPPIDKILINVTNETDPGKIDSFVTGFKSCYDTQGFKSSILYDGMRDLLEELFKKNIRLYIVTNKREKPTKLITSHLGIGHFFSGFYCGDSKERYSSKAVMVKDLLDVEKLNGTNSILIGDTVQDEVAAKQNNIPFVYAAYGYGKLPGIERCIQRPLETLNFINYINHNGK